MCYGFGGDLVSVANKKEMDFVYSLSPKTTDNPAWIGLVYQFQKNECLWSNGESFNGSFSVESLEYYMNSAVREDKCGEIFRNDLNLTKCCKKNKYFICERAKGKLFLRKKLRVGGVVFLSQQHLINYIYKPVKSTGPSVNKYKDTNRF